MNVFFLASILFLLCVSAKTPECAISPWPPATFDNPFFWEDLADPDVFRVDDVFYYSASSMHYSPGAPLLRSYDLVNWEFAGHSVPSLDFGAKYNLNGSQGYVAGVWASFLRYRNSTNLFYWGGCVDFSKTYIYTSPSPAGPWERRAVLNKCYYDAGLLIDDDDKLYVSYGSSDIEVAALSDDGFSEVSSQTVWSTTPDIGYVEGSRMYKINGIYYIIITRPASAQYVLKSTGGPFGPYEVRVLVETVTSPISSSGNPKQGSFVETVGGEWWYIAIIDPFPGGRIPVMAPIVFGADGWPTAQLDSGAWGKTYQFPNVTCPPVAVKPLTGLDSFESAPLGPEWEWNHNPDNTKWSIQHGVILQTATVTTDLYKARNTLTHRILGPESNCTIVLDYENMADGDRSGFALLRHISAYIGVKKDGGISKLVMVNNITMDKDNEWATISNGTEVASIDIPGENTDKVWLRIAADIRGGASSQGFFFYSFDGLTFQGLGPSFTMNPDWQFFMGYRFAMFNYASKALGGSVTVRSFEMVT